MLYCFLHSNQTVVARETTLLLVVATTLITAKTSIAAASPSPGPSLLSTLPPVATTSMVPT